MRVGAAALVVLVLALPSWGAQPRHASLQLARLAPLTIAGRGFSELESVKLTAVASGAVRTAMTAASREGRLRKRFDLRLTGCSPFVVRAVGARGSRAILQVEPGCKPRKRRR